MQRPLRATLGLLTALLLLAPGPAFADVSAEVVDWPYPVPEWGYLPPVIQVQPGEWVTWSNAGEDAHTVTAYDGSFDSDFFGPSEGFSWYFEAPGVYEYYCTLHPWMRGVVEVLGPAVPSDSLEPPAADQSWEDAPPAHDEPSLPYDEAAAHASAW